MKYTLKPIKWTESVDKEYYHSPTHKYSLRYDTQEGAYTVTYLNKESMNTDVAYFSTRAIAKDWVENTHVPAKLREWFNEV